MNKAASKEISGREKNTDRSFIKDRDSIENT